MALVTPAWNLAFSKEVNKVGWARTGLHPFTWCVYHKLLAEEAASAQTLRA